MRERSETGLQKSSPILPCPSQGSREKLQALDALLPREKTTPAGLGEMLKQGLPAPAWLPACCRAAQGTLCRAEMHKAAGHQGPVLGSAIAEVTFLPG